MVPEVTLDTLADDIAGALDSLDLGQVILAGHSYAGAELTVFASRHPGQASALIYIDALYDTGPSFTAPDLFGVISQALVPELKAQPSLEDYRENVALQGCPFPAAAIPAHWLADPSGRYIRDIADSASTQAILEAPEVFLWEALRRRARSYFASQVPHAIFQGIPAAGHCIFMTHPCEVVPSTDTFLQFVR